MRTGKVFRVAAVLALLLVGLAGMGSTASSETYSTGDYAQGVDWSGDDSQVAVADGSNGLVVFDTSDWSSNQYSTGDSAKGVDWSGDDSQVAVADGSNGLVVLSFNSAPTFDQNEVTPDPPEIGNYPDYSMDASDSDGTIESYAFTVYDDGTQVFSDSSSTVSTSQLNKTWTDVAQATEGSWDAKFQVTDDAGATTTKWLNRTLTNTPPTINSNTTRPAPDQVLSGDVLDTVVNATDNSSDNDNDEMSAWVSVWEGGTLLVDNKSMSEPTQGDFEDLDTFTADEFNTPYDVMYVVGDSENSTASLSFQLTDDPPNVDVQDPDNTTYFDYDNSWQVSVSDSDSNPDEDITCDLYNDTAQFDSFTVKEGNTASGTFRASLGQHTFNASCTDPAGNTNSSTVDFTVDNVEIQSQTAPSTVYETENTTYTGTWKLGDMVDDLDTTLYWNDTRRDSNRHIGAGVRTTSLDHYFQPPLVQTNTTTEQWTLQYDVNYTEEDGTRTSDVLNTTVQNQDVWIGYFVQNFGINEDDVIEARDVNADFDIIEKMGGAADKSSSIEYNGTTKTGTAATFHAPVIGNQSVQTVSTSASGETTFSFRDRSKTLQTSSDSVTVHNKILTDCGAGTASQTTAFNFLLRNEENRTEKVSGSVDYNLDTTVTGRDTDNFGFSRTGKEISTCIYPTWAEYRLTGPIQYDAENYTDRQYDVYNITVNDNPEDYNLYLLPNEYSSSVFFEVVDGAGNPVTDATVKVLRYFVPTDSYVTVAKTTTDSEGVGTTYMRVNEIYYKYVVSKEGDVLRETNREILACETTPCTKTIQINPEIVEEYYSQKGGFSYNCEVNEDGPNVQCTVSYKDASMQKATLNVWESHPIGRTNVCNATVQSSGASMVCPVSNLTGNFYEYSLTGTVDDTTYDLTSGTAGEKKKPFSEGGVFLGMLLFLAITGIGYVRPAQGIMFAILGLLAAIYTKMFVLAAGPAVALVVVGIISLLEVER